MGAIVNDLSVMGKPPLSAKKLRERQQEDLRRIVGRRYTLRSSLCEAGDHRYRQICPEFLPHNVDTTFARWEECLGQKFEPLPEGPIHVELFWPAANPFSWHGLIDEIRQRGLRQPQTPRLALRCWHEVDIPVDTPIIFPHPHMMDGIRRRLIVMEKQDHSGISLGAYWFELERFVELRQGKVQFVGLV